MQNMSLPVFGRGFESYHHRQKSASTVRCLPIFPFHFSFRRFRALPLYSPSGEAHDTEAAGTAVAGDDAAGLHPDDMLKTMRSGALLGCLFAGVFQTGRPNEIQHFFSSRCFSEKSPISLGMSLTSAPRYFFLASNFPPTISMQGCRFSRFPVSATTLLTRPPARR